MQLPATENSTVAVKISLHSRVGRFGVVVTALITSTKLTTSRQVCIGIGFLSRSTIPVLYLSMKLRPTQPGYAYVGKCSDYC